MKRLSLVLLLVAFSAAVSNAQIRPGMAQDNISTNEEIVMWNATHANLLNQQNAKLDSRKIALIVSLAGTGVTLTGEVIALTADSKAGNAIMAVGEVTSLVGSIWILVNEFSLIKTQKQINEHLMLRYGPTGVALSF